MLVSQDQNIILQLWVCIIRIILYVKCVNNDGVNKQMDWVHVKRLARKEICCVSQICTVSFIFISNLLYFCKLLTVKDAIRISSIFFKFGTKVDTTVHSYILCHAQSGFL